MKITRLQFAVVSVVVVIGAKMALLMPLMKPEAAAPLVWALVLMGLARVGVAAFKGLGIGGRTPPVRDHIILSHGEIA